MTNAQNAALKTEPQKTGYSLKIAAVLLALTAAAIWGGGFIFTKSSLSSIPPLYFLFFRFSLGALVTAACAGRKLAHISPELLKKGLLLGLPLFFGYALQIIGLQYTSVGNSAFITGSFVVIIPFVNWFFTRRLHRAQIILGCLALLGLAVFSLQGELTANPGDLWTLACAAVYALHFVLLGRYTQGMDSLLLTFLQIAASAVLGGIFAFSLEAPPPAASFGRDTWLALAYCGVMATALCFFIQTVAQKILSPTQVSVLFTSEALFASFFAWLFLGETLSPRQFLGAGILLFSMIGVLLRKDK